MTTYTNDGMAPDLALSSKWHKSGRFALEDVDLQMMEDLDNNKTKAKSYASSAYWHDTLQSLNTVASANDVELKTQSIQSVQSRPKLEAPQTQLTSTAADAMTEVEDSLLAIKSIKSDHLILRLLFQHLEIQKASREASTHAAQTIVFKEQEIQKKKQQEAFAKQDLIREAKESSTITGWVDTALKIGLVISTIASIALFFTGAGVAVFSAINGTLGISKGVTTLVEAKYKNDGSKHTQDLIMVQREREVSHKKSHEALEISKHLLEYLTKYIKLQREVLKNTVQTTTAIFR